MSNNKDECCTPKGQVPRYVDCVGCDKKPIEGATLSYAQAQKDSFSIMEKKQSSIKWYANASHELIVKKSNGEITEREFLTMHHNLFYDAEAMHKEEIEEAYVDGQTSSNAYQGASDYYNTEYGDEN